MRELAGLPGLLARVDPDMRTSPPVGEPRTRDLLPALVPQVRRARRRRMFVTAGLAAAAVVVFVVSLAVTDAVDSDQEPDPAPPGTTLTPPRGEAMTPVGETP